MIQKIKLVAVHCALFPVYLYRWIIRPWKPRTCGFVPSCSEYAIEAIKTRGIIVGWLLAVWRVLRCNPFNKNQGYDPVPMRNTKNEIINEAEQEATG